MPRLTDGRTNGARVFCVIQGLAGMLHSSLELLRRLQAAGHRVVCLGPAEAAETAEAYGVPFRALEPNRLPDFRRADAKASWISKWSRLSSRRDEAVNAMALGEFSQLLQEDPPDLVLVDGEMHEHIVVAMGSSAPIALLNTFASIWRRPGLPPTHRLARPGVGWKGTPWGMAALWTELRLRKVRTAWRLRFRDAGCDRLSLLRHLARQAGAEFESEADFSQWLIPLTYRTLPVLSLHALEFEFPHEPRPGVHYVGPLVPSERPGPVLGPSEQLRLDAAYMRSREGGKLIYAGFGSEFTTGRSFIEALLAALQPEWELLLSTGGRDCPEWLQDLPPNVHVFPWLPQLKVLREADVAVTHGGINTVDECVLARVPMLVRCGHETDMAGNTSRVVHHGLGLEASERSQDLRLQLDRMFADERFSQKLESMARAYEAYAQESVAERVVSDLLGEAV